MSAAPRLDLRDQQAIVQELRAKLPGYVPNWLPVSGGAGSALLQVLGRYSQILIERLNQAPDRDKLAFLDMLGVSLLPAQAGRAPVVFTAMSRMGDGRVPAHSRLGAKVPGRNEPLIFETETDIALAGARLAEMIALWPGQDKYADHTASAIGGQPFTLFTPLQPIPHELYLAHDTLLALAGTSTIEIQFALSSTASEPLALAWEYWNGQMWSAFKAFRPPEEASSGDSLDGTQGFTRSGIIRLTADCASAQKKKVSGVESFWVRARNQKPMPAEAGRVWPRIDRVSIRSIISNPLLHFAPGKRETAAKGTLAVRGGAFNDPRGKSELLGPHFSETKSTVKSETAAEWTGLKDGPYHLHITQPGYAHFDFTFALSPFEGLELFINTSVERYGIEPEGGYAEGQKLDLTKAFYPFGQQAQAGNCFYIKSAEAFSKPGAHIVLRGNGVSTPQGNLDGKVELALVAETWDGERWIDVGASASDLRFLFTTDAETRVQFDLPGHLATTKVLDEEGYWLRIRITKGAFAIPRVIEVKDADLTVIEYRPKPIEHVRIGYEYSSPMEAPQLCLTYNDFQWQDRTGDARRQGMPFEPFSPVEDRAPTLYLGFDSALPSDLISLFLDIEEVPGEIHGPPLRWEYWDGSAWLPLIVSDETRNLALPGMVSILWPGVSTSPPANVQKATGTEIHLTDAHDGPRFLAGDRLFIEQNGDGELVTLASSSQAILTTKTPLEKDYTNAQIAIAGLLRFGVPRTWLRARVQEESEPRLARFNGIHINSVWASQVQTFENEPLGSSNGQLNQVFFLRNSPVLTDQVIEVRELDGARARVELALLIQDLQTHGMSESDVRIVNDRRTGHISQVWVRWQERSNLLFSGPGDRHYVVERSRGRIAFGDNVHGRIPPVGPDNIQAKYYRAGGGLDSNVSAGAINQILAGVLAKAVTNPRPAEGGADAETVGGVLDRGPLVIRNRHQALSAGDYEALAREASPAVAVARALPTTHPSGRFAAGWVKIVIMPHSYDPKPQPSFELRRLVRNFLVNRMPASVSGQIDVVGPDYLEVGVMAVVAPQRLEAAGPVVERVTRRLQSFLNPLTGGPDGKGWPFGRDVYLSDVAAILEGVPGVDYVSTLELTLGGTPNGEAVPVPEDRIVVAGPLRVRLAGDGA